ncbi:dimethylglycine dehydrogenase, mitochondrial [Trichonephila clavipes]|nr:dimethylglycine dehydrogenase, mitochondrial [Trichonephila clavipes]
MRTSACSECSDDRPHLSGCHSGTTCTFVWGGMGAEFLFMDDNARPYRSNIVDECLQSEDITGGLYTPYDGHIDPYSLAMAYAAGARKYGATIILGCPVDGLKPRADGLWEVETPQGTFTTKRVINASGFWAHEIGRLTETELPLVPVEHQYIITKPIKKVQELSVNIHRQITEVYGTDAMSDSKVRKWVRKFKDGRTNVHDEECSGWLSVITDDLMQAVSKV